MNDTHKDYNVYKALAPHIAEPAFATTDNLDRFYLVVGIALYAATLAMIVLALGGK